MFAKFTLRFVKILRVCQKPKSQKAKKYKYFPFVDWACL